MSAPRIAVSGLHRGENPQPGAGIIRSLRAQWPHAQIVGLVYDAMESGIYVTEGPDAVYAMPYPTAGAEIYLKRLDEIAAQSPFDILIPTLDAEIEVLVHVEKALMERGILVCLPRRDSLDRRSKERLPALAKACEVGVPDTRLAVDVGGALQVAAEWGYPLIVKGKYYDARMVADPEDLRKAALKLLSEWGAPIILQRCVKGSEFNVLGLGDGSGDTLGLCAIRKTVISNQGKGLGGMTVRDPRLDQLSTRLIRELRWRGPFEIEVMKDETTGEYVLIEINPRFPAWVDFPSQFGVNFVAALVRVIAGEPRPLLPPCAAGYYYLRHQIEVVGHVDQFSKLAVEGGWSGGPKSPDLRTVEASSSRLRNVFAAASSVLPGGAP